MTREIDRRRRVGDSESGDSYFGLSGTGWCTPIYPTEIRVFTVTIRTGFRVLRVWVLRFQVRVFRVRGSGFGFCAQATGWSDGDAGILGADGAPDLPSSSSESPSRSDHLFPCPTCTATVLTLPASRDPAAGECVRFLAAPWFAGAMDVGREALLMRRSKGKKRQSAAAAHAERDSGAGAGSACSCGTTTNCCRWATRSSSSLAVHSSGGSSAGSRPRLVYAFLSRSPILKLVHLCYGCWLRH
jgi:hypothetical protein